MIIVPIIPFPVLRTPEIPDVFSEVRSQTVVSFTSQNVNTVVSPVVVIFLFSLPSVPSPPAHQVVHLLVAFITSQRNIRPKARAADTKTGTIASAINSLGVNLSSTHFFHPVT